MTYTVKQGDTLYGISNQYGVSVTELARINNVTANNLKVGQVLRIPDKSGINPDNMFMYTVKKGDSLYSIASKYNTTVKDIMDLNNLKSTNLSIGQMLRIPEKYTTNDIVLECIGTPWKYNDTSNEFTYTVKKGDSLYKIANTYGTTISKIVSLNNLKNTNLSIGQKLKIPVQNNSKKYAVKKGDSLYKIANMFNTTVDSIKKKNNLKSNVLTIGQVLNI